MAQWTNIPTDRIEPGKPIRAIDGLALRDNPIAIAEGASGAPRVQTNGIANSAVTTAKIANSSVTAQKLATGGSENNWTRSRIASSTAGQVGTYAFVSRMTRSNSTGRVLWGGTAPGSSLRAALVMGDLSIPGGGAVLVGNDNMSNPLPPVTLSGTWRIMGLATGGRTGEPNFGTLALRIA